MIKWLNEWFGYDPNPTPALPYPECTHEWAPWRQDFYDYFDDTLYQYRTCYRCGFREMRKDKVR